ncbi:hypothetical protein [Acetobacter sp. P5B1]|uniref:hypothetical protein n=1 Tax=Acetobacter sp. P5B1 TaxID=2762620 RepID=UPI001C0434D7|nr:hypothetical protein [Acetobacter sp. P5B1]
MLPGGGATEGVRAHCAGIRNGGCGLSVRTLTALMRAVGVGAMHNTVQSSG